MIVPVKVQHESMDHARSQAPGRLATAALAAIALFGTLCAATPVMSAPSVVIYNSIPGRALPGNIASVGFQATQTREFGDHVRFAAGTSRKASRVDVAMSSWGCQTGHWTGDPSPCVTTKGSKFTHPITLNIYAAVPGTPATVGALLATRTQSFAIALRPSADAENCPDAPTKWYSTRDDACYNGYATIIHFDLSSLNLTLPDEVILGVAYNTSGYGSAPLGYATPCALTATGCGYDSLNVGADSNGVGATVGTDVVPAVAYLSTLSAGNYCDNGMTGTFRADDGCPAGSGWENNTPTFRVRAVKMKPAHGHGGH